MIYVIKCECPRCHYSMADSHAYYCDGPHSALDDHIILAEQLRAMGWGVVDFGGRSPYLAASPDERELDRLEFLSARQVQQYRSQYKHITFVHVSHYELPDGRMIFPASVHGCGKVRCNQAVVVTPPLRVLSQQEFGLMFGLI